MICTNMSTFFARFVFVGLVCICLKNGVSPSHIDSGTYQEGKRQYELIQHQAQLPRYGKCWKDAMVFTESGCQKLTDDMQGRLALAYLNCLLELQGRKGYDCQQTESLEECTRTMEDADRGSFTTFFTHTQNICYFLRAQVWNEATDKTISLLAESSTEVAEQLKESSVLQAEMLQQQMDSLNNQKMLMENAANLTNTLSSSSVEINRLFNTFKETTQEQRLLISSMFDQLTSLKQTVLGEFSGFYSILYYFFSVLVCYLLTSTTRTSGARFWLFSVMTGNVFCECLVTAWCSSTLMLFNMPLESHEDLLYWIRNTFRKFFAGLGILILAWFAFTYRDINSVNNHLLVEIRKQNSDLKRLLHDVQSSTATEKRPNGVAAGIMSAIDNKPTSDSTSTDSPSETASTDSESDRTYVLQGTEDDSLSESDSYVTAETLYSSSRLSSSSGRLASLREELRDLRCATPLKEISGQMERWVSTGLYSKSQHPADGASGTPVAGMGVGTGSPYSLRPRRGRQSHWSPVVEMESPHSFAKTVRQLERIADKNSRMVCAAVTTKQHR